jgi:hypothetical protein
MHRVAHGFRPSAVTMLGGLFMAAGSLVYMNDSIPKLRNLHTMLWPAFALMAIGAIVAFCGAVFIDRRGA